MENPPEKFYNPLDGASVAFIATAFATFATFAMNVVQQREANDGHRYQHNDKADGCALRLSLVHERGQDVGRGNEREHTLLSWRIDNHKPTRSSMLVPYANAITARWPCDRCGHVE